MELRYAKPGKPSLNGIAERIKTHWG